MTAMPPPAAAEPGSSSSDASAAPDPAAAGGNAGTQTTETIADGAGGKPDEGAPALGGAAASDGDGKDPAKERSSAEEPGDTGQKTDDAASEERYGAPDAYEWEAVDGHELAPEVLEAFGGVAKELNLSKASAQKVLNQVVPVLRKTTQDQLQAQVDTQRTEWAEQLRNHPEMGGDKLKETLRVSNLAYRELVSEPLQQRMAALGIDQDPEMVKVFHEIGKRFSQEDGFVGGGTQSGGDGAGGATQGPRSVKQLAKSMFSKKLAEHSQASR